MLAFIMRHGAAEENHQKGDSFRELTETGRRTVEEVGKSIGAFLPLDAIFASPFVRTRQTAQIIARAYSEELSVFVEPGLASGQGAESYQNVIDAAASFSMVLFVGHMPEVATVCELMTGDEKMAMLPFSPGSIAVLDLRGGVREVLGFSQPCQLGGLMRAIGAM